MNILQYDGTFEGLLSIVAASMEESDAPDAIEARRPWQAEAAPVLFGEVRYVETDDERAQNLIGQLRLQPDGLLRSIGCAFLSEDDGIELSILRLIRQCLFQAKAPAHRLRDPDLAAIEESARRTIRERHRMLGLVRFQKLRNGIFWSRIRPRHNILPLLGEHFRRRMGNDEWVITDQQRTSALWFQQGRLEYAPLTELEHLPQMHHEEEFIQDLWRRYFDQIAIAERANPSLQRSFLPRRYRSALVELGFT